MAKANLKKRKRTSETKADKTAKADKMTVLQRVNEILAIRLQGGEFPEILQFASEKQWGVCERQLRNYIAKSDELLAQTLEQDRVRLFNRHVASRRALYARCMAINDYSNARQVLKDEAELLGLYPAKRTELSGPGGGAIPFVELTDDERRNALLAILAEDALGAPGGGPGPPGEDDAAGPPLGQPEHGNDRVGFNP